MSIYRTLVFLVLLVVASLTPNAKALSETGPTTIKYVDNPGGSSPGVVNLPPAVHHAEDRSGNYYHTPILLSMLWQSMCFHLDQPVPYQILMQAS